MIKTARWLAVFALCAIYVRAEHASVFTFATERIPILYKPEDGTISRTVKVTNRTSAPQQIESIAVTCSCITATCSKEVFAPGESADLFITIDVARKRGEFLGTIAIKGKKDLKDSAANLSIQLSDHIKRLAVSSPNRMMKWRVGDKPVHKSVSFTVSGEVSPDQIAVISSNPAFVVTLEPQSKNEFRISAMPAETKSPQTCVIKVQLRQRADQADAESFYAVVM